MILSRIVWNPYTSTRSDRQAALADLVKRGGKAERDPTSGYRIAGAAEVIAWRIWWP